VVAVVKRLKVVATYHKIWKAVSGHVVALQTYVLHIGCVYGPTVACGGPDPRVGMKGKWLLRNEHWMFQACELGLALQGYETQFRIVRFSPEIETACSFCQIE
jgi:hypothetical protein